ncbi:MAG: M48 family metallopeptidase [Verrucomicrobiota bacterium]|jgi:predicted metal-dependent hydrolase
MLFDLVSRWRSAGPAPPEFLQVGARTVRLLIVRNPRARRYLLRVQPDGSARVTIPRGGSRGEAQSFVERNRGWLERQLEHIHAQPRLSKVWQAGTEILFRGERVRIEAQANGGFRIGAEVLPISNTRADLRPAIEWHFRLLASQELPARVLELAAPHRLVVRRVTVRNQRVRWGSCSRHGAISLNWRLVLVPDSVRDYIILHELAHLRELNHSDRFWREVERLCPDYGAAEKWLKANGQLLS